MSTFKNTGAPFLRHDGVTWVERGEVFEATDAEARQFAYKLHPHAPPDPPPGIWIPEPGEEAPVQSEDAPVEKIPRRRKHADTDE